MKATLRLACQLSASALALGTAAHLAGVVSVPGLANDALIGGLAVASLIAFALRDYSHKPSFRVRRAPTSPCQDEADADGRPAAASVDWTYTTRTA